FVLRRCRYVTCFFLFFFSSRRRHTRFSRDWSSDVCSSDLPWFDTTTASAPVFSASRASSGSRMPFSTSLPGQIERIHAISFQLRSEERRVGKECRSRWSGDL